MGSRRKATDGSEHKLRTISALSLGELDTSDQYYFRWMTAMWFLAAVIKRFPAAGAELEQCPFSKARIARSPQRFVRWVEQWARASRIESPFVIRVAAESLAYWKETGERGPIKLRWSSDHKTTGIEKPPLPLFDPLLETEAEWLRRVTNWTKHVIRDYRRQGYRSARRKNEPIHYQWLARRTVGRETLTTIALDRKRDVTKSDDGEPGNFLPTVGDATRRLAKAIDLPLK